MLSTTVTASTTSLQQPPTLTLTANTVAATSALTSTGLTAPLKLGTLPAAATTTVAASTGLSGLGGAGGSGLKLGGVSQGLGLAGTKTTATTVQTSVPASSSSAGFKGLGGVDPSTSTGSNGGIGG